MKRSRINPISKKQEEMLKRVTKDRDQWALEHGDFCWICGYVQSDWGEPESYRPIDTHEMVPRSQSKDAIQRANYFRVCRSCHSDVIPGMPIEYQLSYKILYDYNNYDIDALQAIRTKIIDEVEVLNLYAALKLLKGERR